MKLYLFRIATVISFAMMLAACFPSHKPAAAAPENKAVSWQQRQQQLQQVTAWQAAGAVAIRTQQKAESASVKWQQQSQSTFAIRLFGPLGAGNTIIIGKPGKVTLTTPQNRTYTASSSEALLKQQTGWQIPISNLYYWIRGLPVPGISKQVSYDSFQHLSTLKQQGWSISYQRYTAVNGIDLPSKLSLSNGRLTAKIVINQWQIRS